MRNKKKTTSLVLFRHYASIGSSTGLIGYTTKNSHRSLPSEASSPRFTLCATITLCPLTSTENKSSHLNMPSQRPYFLSSFLAAFRPQGPSIPASTQHPQPNKHSHSHSHAHTAQASASSNSSSTARASPNASQQQSHSSVAIHSPRGASSSAGNVAGSPGAGIPIPSSSNRRRGSDSSSEGFREVLGADKWYIGGRTPGGEEKFFKMGVIRRMRSSDGLSLDRLSL